MAENELRAPEDDIKISEKGLIEKFLDWRHSNPDQSLILTPSTERSIILTILVTGCIVMLFKAIEVPEWYISTLSMAMGYYFGRSKN